MSIKSVEELNKGKIKINLKGPDGNAYSLMGHTQSICKQLGIDPKPIIQEMMSKDYENLIKVFDKNFGDYVDLYR